MTSPDTADNDRRERKRDPRPSLLEMGRLIGDLDAVQTATLKAADDVFAGLAALYGLSESNSFEAIEGRARQRYAEHKAAGDALALIADCMPDDDHVSQLEPMALAEQVTARLSNWAERLDGAAGRDRDHRLQTATWKATTAEMQGAMADAYLDAERALSLTPALVDVAVLRERLTASPRLLVTSVHALATAYSTALTSDEAYGRLDTGTQDLDLFDGDEFSTPASLVEAVLVKLRDADDAAGKLEETESVRDMLLGALADVAGHHGMPADTPHPAVVFASHARARAWEEIERSYRQGYATDDSPADSLVPGQLAARVSSALHAGNRDRGALIEARDMLGLAESSGVRAILDEIGRRAESDRAADAVAKINAEALAAITRLVMTPNPAAVDVPPERRVEPYAHEVVTAVRQVRERLHAVTYPLAEEFRPESLTSITDDVVGLLDRWRAAARVMIAASADRIVKPEQVLSANLTPAQTQQFVVDKLTALSTVAPEPEPVAEPTGWAGAVELLRVAAILDPTDGGATTKRVPDQHGDAGKTLAVWQTKTWTALWLMHRALGLVDGGQQ